MDYTDDELLLKSIPNGKISNYNDSAVLPNKNFKACRMHDTPDNVDKRLKVEELYESYLFNTGY